MQSCEECCGVNMLIWLESEIIDIPAVQTVSFGGGSIGVNYVTACVFWAGI